MKSPISSFIIDTHFNYYGLSAVCSLTGTPGVEKKKLEVIKIDSDLIRYRSLPENDDKRILLVDVEKRIRRHLLENIAKPDDLVIRSMMHHIPELNLTLDFMTFTPSEKLLYIKIHNRDNLLERLNAIMDRDDRDLVTFNRFNMIRLLRRPDAGIADYFPSPLFLADPDSRIIWANRTFFTTFNLREKKAGDPFFISELLTDSFLNTVNLKNIKKEMVSLKPVERIFQFKRPESLSFWGRVRMSYHDETEMIFGIITELDDIQTDDFSLKPEDLFSEKNNTRDRVNSATIKFKKRNLTGMLKNHELSNSIDNDQLTVHYQTRINTDYKVIGAEALVRWNNPDHGLMYPGEFIKSAEESGFIHDIGNYVLRSACSFIEQCRSGNIDIPTVAVNLSPVQVAHPDIVTSLIAAVTRERIDPSKFELEITENCFLNDENDCISKFQKLRDAGFKISLDNFGAGYSCLAKLDRFPISAIKLDRSFIHDTIDNKRSRIIMKHVIDLSHALNIRITAGGIENQEEFQFLKKKKCDMFQGYLFGHPLPGNELIEALSRKDSID